MNKGLYAVTFAAGVGIGSVTAWRYTKKKYEKITQEEINSVKEVFGKRTCVQTEQLHKVDQNDVQAVAEQAKEKPDVAEYAALVQRYGGNMNEEKADASFMKSGYLECKEETMSGKYPYVISPEEFGEFDDYEKISLTYYADEVLADDNDEIVSESVVGDALNHFGEFEDDSVFVRCDEKKCDYEILLDQRNFSEAVGDRPHRVEV